MQIIKFLKESNRYKHLIGGFIVSIITNIIFINYNCWFVGIYASLCCAGSLEFKDKQTGGKWDWIDFAMTVIGGLFGTIINVFI